MGFDRRPFRISSGLFADVQSYLDEMYVEERLGEEYRDDDRSRYGMVLRAPAEGGLVEEPLARGGSSGREGGLIWQIWRQRLNDVCTTKKTANAVLGFLKEPLIHSAPCLCVSALSSRLRQILSVALLRFRFVSEEYSASTQIQGTSFNQRFLKHFSPISGEG